MSRVMRNSHAFLGYFPSFLWKNFTISTTGITKRANPIAVKYSAAETVVNSKIFLRNGI